jgi:hypothetical protein
MRLYILLLLSFALAACAGTRATESIAVTVSVDGQQRELAVPAGSSVRELLNTAGVELGPRDRSEPPSYTELADGDEVRVIRVVEEFEIEQVDLPFVSRTLPNEALPVGEQRMIQNGANGLQEVTYRLVYEDGKLVSRSQVDAVVLTQPVEEIIMIGAQSPFSSVEINGQLAFISGGNAWVLEGSSGTRRAVAITGDLDGRIFELSPDGRWLLFTRDSQADDAINELWVASLTSSEQTLIDLGVENVVHYAEWAPESGEIAFSTVDFALNPPGWQANNDLQILSFEDGEVADVRTVLTARADGFYAWWGTSYAWSPDGDRLAFTRPDAVGTVNLAEDSLDVWYTLPAYQTGSDWAWIPGLTWLDDERFYYIRHELNPSSFALMLAGDEGAQTIVAEVGMFAQPVAAPDGSQVAFLRAYIPTQSDISSYELMVATAEGASMALFPPEGAAGLQPQRVAWSPGDGAPMIAFTYEGNLWVVNIVTGEAQQLTGDGLVTAISWR